MESRSSLMPAGLAGAPTGVVLRLALVPLIWGGTFIAGRLLVATIPAALGSLLRYLVACVALLVTLLLVEGRLPRLDRKQMLATFLLGATGIFAYNLFFLGALERLPASRTSLIVALNPALTIAAMALIWGEHVRPIRWLGVALALLGVWIVVSHGDLASIFTAGVGPGELLMFGGAVSWAAYTALGRTAMKGLTPLAATTWASLWGTLLLLFVAGPALISTPVSAYTPAVMLQVLYLGVLGTAVAFVWYYDAIRVIGPSRTVIFNNLVPLFGATFGVLLLNEPLDASMVIGAIVAVGGVMIASRS